MLFQQYFLWPIKFDFYIKNVRNDLYVHSKSNDEGDYVYQGDMKNQTSEFIIEPVGEDGLFSIRNKNNNLYLTGTDSTTLRQKTFDSSKSTWLINNVDYEPPQPPLPPDHYGKPAPIPSELNRLTQFQKGNNDDIYNLPSKPTYNFAAFEDVPTKEEDYHIMVQMHTVGRSVSDDLNKGPQFNKPLRGHVIDYVISNNDATITQDEISSSTSARLITRTVDYTVKNLIPVSSCTFNDYQYTISSANIVPDQSKGWNNLSLDRWDKRLPRIIEYLEDSDIICCQEMTQGQVNTMMDSTLFSNNYGVVSSSKDYDSSMMFYNKSKYAAAAAAVAPPPSTVAI